MIIKRDRNTIIECEIKHNLIILKLFIRNLIMGRIELTKEEWKKITEFLKKEKLL